MGVLVGLGRGSVDGAGDGAEFGCCVGSVVGLMPRRMGTDAAEAVAVTAIPRVDERVFEKEGA